MTQDTLYNAVLATGYITLVASIMYYAPRWAGPAESVLVPIAVLSLFVLSAAVMGYIFFYQPVQLYLAGRQKEGINLFLKTVGFFAGITALLLATLFASAA